MKVLSMAIALFSLTLLFSGCGKDGKSGSATLALDWDWYVDGYNDDNPGIPSVVSRNFDYSSKPGKFNCEYACSDGNGNQWYWQYQYTISVNAGKPGKGFKDGADGATRRHLLFLNGFSEPTLSTKATGVSPKKLKKQLSGYKQKPGLTKVYHGEPVFDEYSENGYTISIKRQLFTLEK